MSDSGSKLVGLPLWYEYGFNIVQTWGASGYMVSSVVTARGRLPGALLGTLIVIHHRIDHNQNQFYYFKVVNDASGGGAQAQVGRVR